MSALVTLIDGQAVTTSLAIADGAGVQHESVLRLLDNNLSDFEEFGRGVRFEIGPFETAGGTQNRRYAVLTEEQATLLLTFMRNSDAVVRFKVALVKAFFELRDRAIEQPALQGPELLAAAVLEAAEMLKAKDQQIAELEPRAAVADKILDATGDLSVRDAAQALTRAGIKVGQNRLFAVLDKSYGWISRAMGDGRYRVKQAAIEAGWMSVIPQSHYHPKTGVLVLDPPQPRVTPKGLQRLLADFGAVPSTT